MTINQLQKMPVGERVGGGFLLTVKQTKKSVQLPNKHYVHTVVLFDETGEMVADFLDPGVGTYSPMIKREQVKIIVAEIQRLVLKPGDNGTKLYVSQFQKLTQTLDEYDAEAAAYKVQWDREVKGKIRHGLICSYLQTQNGKLYLSMQERDAIEELVEYIFNGPEKK